MNTISIRLKLLAFLLILVFTFQPLSSINSHTYSTGFDNFHFECPKGILCCFGVPVHSAYSCGQTYHIP